MSNSGETDIAPSMEQPKISIRDFTELFTYRMLADGVVLYDIHAAIAEVGDWSQWCAFWVDRAKEHESSADESQAQGDSLTAGEHLVRAALCAHYAQFMYFAYPEAKREAAELKVDLFKRAGSLLAFPAERVEIPVGAHHLPGYLRIPVAEGPFACVILLGGLDTTKEDNNQFSELCLARGLATLAFDGPGQGEAFYRGVLFGDEWDDIFGPVMDYIESRPKLADKHAGIVGRSLGGHLAARAAAIEKRIQACVVWSGQYDVSNLDDKPPIIRDGYRFITGGGDWKSTKEALSFVNLDGLASRITCPLLVTHGMLDNSVPASHPKRLAAEAKGDTTLIMVENSIHCNHDLAHIVRPQIADWIAGRLRTAL